MPEEILNIRFAGVIAASYTDVEYAALIRRCKLWIKHHRDQEDDGA